MEMDEASRLISFTDINFIASDGRFENIIMGSRGGEWNAVPYSRQIIADSRLDDIIISAWSIVGTAT
jgi:hypothetical protein